MSYEKIMAIKIKIRLLLWGALLVATLWLLYLAIVPGGKISYSYDMRHDNYFISKLTPTERVEYTNAGTAKVLGDPVYFTLRTPRNFDQATLTIDYKRNDDAAQSNIPVIAAGVLADKTVWRYNLKPVDNLTIDQLAMAWPTIRADDTVLLQRQKKYGSIDDFLADLPPRNEIAVYNYGLNDNFKLADYVPAKSDQPVKAPVLPLRGAYQFYTYIKNETLDFKFSFIDLNRNRDSDPVDVFLYVNDKIVDSRHLDDDGDTTADGKVGAPRTLELKDANLPEGVYKIEIKANDDIVTREIDTAQTKLAFINNLTLAAGVVSGDNSGTAGHVGAVLYTDSRELSAETTDPGALGAIKAGGQTLQLNQTYKQFSLDLSGATTTKISLADADVMLAGDGVFSFSPKALLNPDLKAVDANLDINRDGIDYVIADYVPPVNAGQWQEATVSFDLTRAYSENRQYGFIISVPGLRADDNIADSIEINKIRVDLEGKSLWEKIREIF